MTDFPIAHFEIECSALEWQKNLYMRLGEKICTMIQESVLTTEE